ncbi:unnamed protein product [Musa acuminata subsp. burmannicoides]
MVCKILYSCEREERRVAEQRHLCTHLFGLGGEELDDEAGEDVVGVVDMRVALHDEGISALVADGVERLPLPHHVNLVAPPLHQPPATDRRPPDRLARRWSLPQRAQQQERHDGNRQQPRSGIGDPDGGGKGPPGESGHLR